MQLLLRGRWVSRHEHNFTRPRYGTGRASLFALGMILSPQKRAMRFGSATHVHGFAPVASRLPLLRS